MILSLVFSFTVLAPVIMVFGIVVGDPLRIGASPTAESMNATLWNTYASLYSAYGLIPLFIMATILGVGLLVAFFYVTRKA